MTLWLRVHDAKGQKSRVLSYDPCGYRKLSLGSTEATMFTILTLLLKSRMNQRMSSTHLWKTPSRLDSKSSRDIGTNVLRHKVTISKEVMLKLRYFLLNITSSGYCLIPPHISFLYNIIQTVAPPFKFFCEKQSFRISLSSWFPWVPSDLQLISVEITVSIAQQGLQDSAKVNTPDTKIISLLFLLMYNQK